MKSSKKRSRAVVTVVACILAVCLVAALVLFSLVNSKVRALQKGATFEFSYNITAQDSASTPALYNILKQVGATSGDVAGLYSPGQLQLYLYPSGGLARAETGGTDFFTGLYIDANDTYFHGQKCCLFVHGQIFSYKFPVHVSMSFPVKFIHLL